MACYEWKRSASVNKQIETKHGAKDTDGNPGTRYEYEPTGPEVVHTFSAHGIDWDGDMEALWLMSLLLIDLQAPVTITDKDGRSWSGKIYRFDAGPSADGVDLFDATLQMKYAVRVG